MAILNVAILGTEVGGLAAASKLIQDFGKENVNITFFDPRSWVGGIIRTTAHGDVGPMFVHKKRHKRLTELMKWWVGGIDHFERLFFVGDDEEMYPKDDSYAASSGVTRYLGLAGEKFDSAEVDAGLDELRSSYIPQLLARLDFASFDAVNLTPQQEALQCMSAAQWLNGEPLPGLEDLPLPKVSAAALDSFRWMLGHDNGVALEDQNLLCLLLMFYAGGEGYYSGGTEIVKGGGSTVTRHAHAKLLEEGVEFRLNCRAQLRNADEPVLYFEDGSSETFDFVVVANPPTVHDKCLFDADFQMGKALFWNIRLKPEFAKTITDWDTYSPFGETWQNMLHRDVVVFFAGGPAYDGASAAPPWEALEMAIPGITANVISYDTIDFVKEPNTLGAFSFVKRGKFGAVSRALARAPQQKRVLIVGEWVSDEVGYPGAAVRVTYWVLDQVKATMRAIIAAA